MKIYTVKEIAELFKVGKPTIRTWIKKGELEALRTNKSNYHITEDQLKKFIKNAEIKQGK